MTTPTSVPSSVRYRGCSSPPCRIPRFCSLSGTPKTNGRALLLIRLLPTLIVLLVGDYVVSNRCVFGSDTFGFRAAGGYVYVVCTAAMRTVAMRTDGVAFTFTSYRDSECCFHFH